MTFAAIAAQLGTAGLPAAGAAGAGGGGMAGLLSQAGQAGIQQMNAGQMPGSSGMQTAGPMSSGPMQQGGSYGSPGGLPSLPGGGGGMAGASSGGMASGNPQEQAARGGQPQQLWQDLQKYTTADRANGMAGVSPPQQQANPMEMMQGLFSGQVPKDQQMAAQAGGQMQSLPEMPGAGGKLSLLMARSRAADRNSRDKRTGKMNNSFYMNPAIKSLMENR